MSRTRGIRARQRRADVSCNEGFVAASYARSTGALVSVYVAEAQGLDVAPDRYAVVCEDHGILCGFATLADARAVMPWPANWCEPCAGTELLDGQVAP